MKLQWRAFGTEVFLTISPERDDSNYINVLVWRFSPPAKIVQIDQFSKSYIRNSRKANCPSSVVLRRFIRTFWTKSSKLEL